MEKVWPNSRFFLEFFFFTTFFGLFFNSLKGFFGEADFLEFDKGFDPNDEQPSNPGFDKFLLIDRFLGVSTVLNKFEADN